VGCLKADMLWGAAAFRDAKELRNGYKGNIYKAESNIEEDKKVIIEEIDSDGTAGDVDYSIAVLLSTGVSTASIREVMERVGEIADIRGWSLFAVVLNVGVVWIISPMSQLVSGACGSSLDTFLLLLLPSTGLAWSVIFTSIPLDSKAFATSTLNLLPVVVAPLALLEKRCPWIAWMSLAFLSPFLLAMSAAGPARVARVPFGGSLLVGLLLGARCSWHPMTILENLLAGKVISKDEGIVDSVAPAVVGVGEGAGDGTGLSSSPSSSSAVSSSALSPAQSYTRFDVDIGALNIDDISPALLQPTFSPNFGDSILQSFPAPILLSSSLRSTEHQLLRTA